MTETPVARRGPTIPLKPISEVPGRLMPDAPPNPGRPERGPSKHRVRRAVAVLRHPRLIASLFILAGMTLTAAGAWLIYQPSGYIVGGVELMLFGMLFVELPAAPAPAVPAGER